MPRANIVIFAQVPPPEHGQSRMVLLALETLRDKPELFEVHHVNARFSYSLEDIGESSVGKMLLTAKYLYQALQIRFRVRNPILYYVPGPVKWSSVLRDWALLSVLRLFYPRMVFHWHAIGHGEWAHGSQRLALEGPCWVDWMARKVSAWVLDRPYASIAVCATSGTDSLAVGSKCGLVICNGILDPCPGFDEDLAPLRRDRLHELAAAEHPCFRILFLSHGTLEKGIIDALNCMDQLLEHCDPSWRFQITFAGGVSESIVIKFESMVDTLRPKWLQRIQVIEKGYLTGDDKHRCFVDHDIFLAPSRWESFGLTVIEAMAYGLPVVAAASDGVKGVLPDGYPYLAPVADPTVLAEKLHGCCQALRDRSTEIKRWPLRKRFLSHYQIKDFCGNLTSAFLAFGEDTAREPRDASEEGSARSACHGVVNGDGPRAHPDDQPKQAPGTTIETCSGGVSPSLDTKEDAETQTHETATVIDRRYSSEVSSNQKSTIVNHQSSIEFPSSSSKIQNPKSKFSISAYLADQNPGHDRSFGISRMSQVILDALQAGGRVHIETIASKTSQQGSDRMGSARVLPWGTRRKWVRLLTDHFHPLFYRGAQPADVYYFPKGYLPLTDIFCRPSVVTIHDTIIQYDEDHYPRWRSRFEYGYWAMMLKHTLRKADRILTVSESSKSQIQAFMERHRIPRKEITVTYEPCLYEKIPQPENPAKENYMIHLASCEPHKRTAHLIRWWHEAEKTGRTLPMLHLIGNVPPEVENMLASSRSIVKRPFLDDDALQAAYLEAKALILPSEIEGFGLPALEAYYLGTPVCFVKGTSVEEILSVATAKGGFSLDDPESLFTALDEVLSVSPEEIRACGLKLREAYASGRVAERMISVFDDVANREL